MKKIAALVSALLLVCSISGCSKEDVPAALPETERDAAQTAASEDRISEVPIEIDIFEDAEVLVDKEKLFYPGSLLLEAKSLNSEFPPKTFSVLLTSANLSTITYEIHVDEEKIADYLAENNYVLQSSVKTCEINVDKLPSYLISTELLTQENLQTIDNTFVEMLTDAIEQKNELNSELIEWDNNHADNDFPDARLYDTNISPIARYAVMPNPNFDLKNLDTSDSPGTYASFTCYDNKSYILYTVYSGNDGACYVGSAWLSFDENHVIDTERTSWNWLNRVIYDDFESAYEAFQCDDTETLIFVEVEASALIQTATSELDEPDNPDTTTEP